MPAPRKRLKRKTAAPPAGGNPKALPLAITSDSPLIGVARQLRAWTD